MLTEIGYDRKRVFDYAEKWAFKRNPRYFDFDALGGDCTNFASQCVLAGCDVMNYKPTFGWYYINLNDRTPSWSGVQFLYNFITQNKGVGPYGKIVSLQEAQIGDIIQLSNGNFFYHTLTVTGKSDGNVFIATHTYDSFMRDLNTYSYDSLRCIHIDGARKYVR